MLRLGGSIVILALLLLFLPFADLMGALRRVTPVVWPVAIAAYLCMHLIGVAKWRLLINVAGAGLSFREASRAYYWGLFGNTFLPSIVGGDVVKVGTALRAARSASGLILGSFIDRILDVGGLVVVAGIGAILSPRALDPQSRRIFIGAGLMAGLAGIACVGAVLLMPARRFPFRVRRKLVKVRAALRATAGRPSVLIGALVLGMILQSLLVVLNYWLGIVIGISIPLYVWLFVWPLAKISALLPVTQGGIGVREVAIAALFAPFGVSAARAVASGLVFEAVVIAGGLIGGVVVLVLGSRTSSLAFTRGVHKAT
jgi:uncharacterized membrane protein YbhN (UPF0104 family)